MRHPMMALMVLGLTACEEPTDPADFETGELQMCEVRSSGDAASMIQDAAYADGVLTLDLSKGGCDEGRYRLCWDGMVMESAPPQVNLRLESEGPLPEDCDAFFEFSRSFDLGLLMDDVGGEVTVHLGGVSLQVE